MADNKWNKEQLKLVIKLWPTTSGADIAKQVAHSKGSVMATVSRLRKVGFALPRKPKNSYFKDLVAELKAEAGI